MTSSRSRGRLFDDGFAVINDALAIAHRAVKT
jgi:hypothetical protein